jgi:hypothetical protein
MDDHDTPDWKVNPAYHPEVIAFVRSHANNSAFTQKAEALQKNRAKYYVTMRDRAAAAAAAPPAAAPAPPAAAPSAAPAQAPAPRRTWRRTLRRVAAWTVVLLLLFVFGAVTAALVYRQMAAEMVRAATGQADGADPAWRTADLRGNFADIPDENNPALLVLAAVEKLPPNWRPPARTLAALRTRGPESPLTDDEVLELRLALRQASGALTVARLLDGIRPGRYPNRPDGGPPGVGTFRKVGAVADLLFLDAVEAAHRQDGPAALAAVGAMLAVAASIGDEPNLQAQLTCLSVREGAGRVFERILAQCPVLAKKNLRVVQRLFEAGAARPVLTPALRGERANGFEAFDYMLAGTEPPEFQPNLEENRPGESPGWFDGLTRSVALWFEGGWIEENRARHLELMTEAVGIASLPEGEQYAKFHAWTDKVDELATGNPLRYGIVVSQLMPVREFIANYFRSLAELRCAAAAAAAERYRSATGQWPESIEALAPKYLAAVPLDPYDGQPLRLRRDDEGLVIRSVGTEGTDGVAVRLRDPARRPAPVVR